MTPKRLARTVGFAVLVAVVAAATAAAATHRSSAAPQNTSNPTVEGKFQVNETLTATNGQWSGNPTDFSYKWQRCNSGGTGCADISGATSKSYKLATADVDHSVRVLVTAANSDGQTTVNSRPSPVISANDAPRNSTRPTISGTAAVGETLTVTNGQWSGGARSFTYQWLRCDETGNQCVPVPSSTSQSYNVRTADLNGTVRAEVTAHSPAGNTTVNTDRSSVVTQGSGGNQPPPTTTKCTSGATVAATDVALPQRLLIDKWQFNPGTVTKGMQSFTARIHIGDTCGRSVSGARVWSTAIPYNQTNVAQVTSGSDGWASVTFNVQKGFPANPGRQQILALLVRAMKAGDNPLAGVSTNRVLRVNVNLHG
jgi:hypothetical protein